MGKTTALVRSLHSPHPQVDSIRLKPLRTPTPLSCITRYAAGSFPAPTLSGSRDRTPLFQLGSGAEVSTPDLQLPLPPQSQPRSQQLTAQHLKCPIAIEMSHGNVNSQPKKVSHGDVNVDESADTGVTLITKQSKTKVPNKAPS